VTVTPGRMAPLASLTVPTTLPVSTCANPATATLIRKTTTPMVFLMSDPPSADVMQVSINGSAANLSADSTLPRFAAQKLLRILTESFFLYRFIVFCRK
jgi:hypothetical protein